MNELENTLTYLMTPISNSYGYLLEKSMNEINLHSGQVFVLLSLLKQDGQSQIELSNNLNLAPPTVNKMIKSLTADDFIFTKSDKEDGRILRTFLTQKSRNLESMIEELWVKVEDQMLADFTATEKLILLQLFEKLNVNLNNAINVK